MSSRMPPLYALRAFEAAARCGSFTLAADSLNITQSAVSRHVKTLEQSLGCKVFERKGSRLALTEPGRLLAEELKLGFRIIENACVAVGAGSGSLRLKAPSTLTVRWLLGVLEGYHQAFPDHRIQLTSAWMDVDAVDFHAEPFDCAILLCHGEPGSEVESLRLFDEWLVPVCMSQSGDDRPWSIERLRAAELIHPSRDRRDWKRWLERTGHAESVPWQRGKLFDTLELGISAAAQGHGVSMADLSLIGPELARGTLMMPVRTAVRSGGSYHLIWPRHLGESRALHHLKGYLRERLPSADDADVLRLD
ncbi:LysR family transcriptional regulator [Stutzerimonas urumqiensis]|uniref:LysR substrate-binding domain-containing protein n=1 Tax=Stutzerimonas urumqiensis TaxID=638269 RepID=UPI003BA8B73B